ERSTYIGLVTSTVFVWESAPSSEHQRVTIWDKNLKRGIGMRAHTISTDTAPKPLAHHSQACRTGELIRLAGQLASDFRTGVPAEIRVRPEFPYYGSDIKMQTRYILENMRAVLEEAGSDLEHVVKAQVFLMDQRDFNEFDEVWHEFFPTP